MVSLSHLYHIYNTEGFLYHICSISTCPLTITILAKRHGIKMHVLLYLLPPSTCFQQYQGFCSSACMPSLPQSLICPKSIQSTCDQRFVFKSPKHNSMKSQAISPHLDHYNIHCIPSCISDHRICHTPVLHVNLLCWGGGCGVMCLSAVAISLWPTPLWIINGVNMSCIRV